MTANFWCIRPASFSPFLALAPEIRRTVIFCASKNFPLDFSLASRIPGRPRPGRRRRAFSLAPARSAIIAGKSIDRDQQFFFGRFDFAQNMRRTLSLRTEASLHDHLGPAGRCKRNPTKAQTPRAVNPLFHVPARRGLRSAGFSRPQAHAEDQLLDHQTRLAAARFQTQSASNISFHVRTQLAERKMLGPLKTHVVRVRISRQ